jgi:hypothetical protein
VVPKRQIRDQSAFLPLNPNRLVNFSLYVCGWDFSQLVDAVTGLAGVGTGLIGLHKPRHVTRQSNVALAIGTAAPHACLVWTVEAVFPKARIIVACLDRLPAACLRKQS